MSYVYVNTQKRERRHHVTVFGLFDPLRIVNAIVMPTNLVCVWWPLLGRQLYVKEPKMWAENTLDRLFEVIRKCEQQLKSVFFHFILFLLSLCDLWELMTSTSKIYAIPICTFGIKEKICWRLRMKKRLMKEQYTICTNSQAAVAALVASGTKSLLVADCTEKLTALS